ncbi:MAG: protease inhibitor I42 family protein [Candidatus Omnitrophota bacterium]
MRNLSTRIAVTALLSLVVITAVITGCAREKVIKTKQGKEFTISLSALKISPFEWELAEPLDEDILTLVGSEFKASKKGPKGMIGKEVWTFKAVGKGETAVAFRRKNISTGEAEMIPGGKIAIPVSVR